MIEPANPPSSAPDTSALALRIYGVPFIIDGLPAELRERFAALMRPFVTHEDVAGPGEAAERLAVRRQETGDWTIIRDEQVVAAYGDPYLVLTQLEWHVVSAFFAATEAFAPIHGAALARDSSVVLLLGDSGAGKSTLTLSLMRRGWLPLSDDIVLIDVETLAVEPFQRCFHVDDATRALAVDESLLEWPGDVRQYARPLRWAPGGQPPTALFLVERCVTCPSRLRAVTLAEAAAAIGSNGIRSRLSKARLANVAVRTAIGAPRGGRLNNGRLDDTLDVIEAVCQ